MDKSSDLIRVGSPSVCVSPHCFTSVPQIVKKTIAFSKVTTCFVKNAIDDVEVDVSGFDVCGHGSTEMLGSVFEHGDGFPIMFDQFLV
jgi:hypothetical protein